ncbi:hypothetical protein B0H67DRAFT_383272 [Lasiosphaeris hirsuta]|uniref:Uncharacterized protein n=1 Tax=Lasiosphaeris hirsuta TaxID=260670 RepID=A0AA39ZXJ1_9PEZI|nr:hypothetical protein B0H67DRAFT_383272 [Lasiosphaeris hirsuta]
MRSVWSCTSCVALLLSALLGSGAEAVHAGRQRRDLIHRVAKAQVTAHPLRRDTSTCATDHSLCPDSVGGGCCPSRYECATDSCYATTAGVTSACGKTGWFACPAADSGGCCPVGYVCGPTDCTAPAGVTNTYTSCPNNYYLCPASFNFGCCKTGMGCAPNACYSTEPVTATVTQTFTTTTNGQTVTTTQTAVTVATPSAPSGLPTDLNVAPKFIPDSVPKSSASVIPSATNAGLTSSQLGGIIGGAVALLVIVLVAAFIIIRRLNRVADIAESKKDSGISSNQTKSQVQLQQINHPYLDDSVDPLMMVTPGGGGTSGAATPPTGIPNRGRADSADNFSPGLHGFSPSGGTSAAARHTSMDSVPGGYFDIPARVHNMPGGQPMTAAALRSSVESYNTQGHFSHYSYHQQHARQQSNASELSDGSDAAPGVTSPLVIQELDSAGAYAELPNNEHTSGIGSPRGRSRASSLVGSPPPQPVAARGSWGGNPRRRSDGVTSVAPGLRGVEGSPPPPGGVGYDGGGVFAPLDVVNESVEIMHGYYGPRDRQAGQTAAGLEVRWDVSSPLVPGLGPGIGPDQMVETPEGHAGHQELPTGQYPG